MRAASTSEPTCVPGAGLCMGMEVLSVLLYIKAEVGGGHGHNKTNQQETQSLLGLVFLLVTLALGKERKRIRSSRANQSELSSHLSYLRPCFRTP